MVAEVLNVEGLSVSYFSKDRYVDAVRSVSFSLHEGEILGIMGESGAGKSTVGWAIMRMIEPPHRVSGRIICDGVDVLNMSDSDLAEYRWKKAAMIFQTAMNALDPVSSVGKSFRRLLVDKGLASTSDQARKLTEQLLESVGLSPIVADMYPFELSGGMKQRVLIAMALSASPKILIADEPTTALDTLTQFSILSKILELREKRKIGSMIFISHDLSVQAYMSDRVMVMLKGRMVELGPKEKVFRSPAHPYTQFLLQSLRFGAQRTKHETKSRASAGCPFAQFCPHAINLCFEQFPRATDLGDTHIVSCFLYGG